MKPILLCINRDRDTVTRYVPVGKQLFPEVFHIEDRAHFDREFSENECEKLRNGARVEPRAQQA